jgi:hypothetical protein
MRVGYLYDMNFETSDNEEGSLILFHPLILRVNVFIGIERTNDSLCSLILLDAYGIKKSVAGRLSRHRPVIFLK